MSECKLILYKDPNFTGESEEFTGDRGVTHNDQASSYKTTGDCSNTSWGVFKDNDGDNKGNGIIMVKVMTLVVILMLIITVRERGV